MFSYTKRSSRTQETVLLKALDNSESDLRKTVFGEYNSFITLKHGFSLHISFPNMLHLSPSPSPSCLISPPPILLLPSSAATVHPIFILISSSSWLLWQEEGRKMWACVLQVTVACGQEAEYLMLEDVINFVTEVNYFISN